MLGIPAVEQAFGVAAEVLRFSQRLSGEHLVLE